MSIPAAWHPDPTGRHEFRYWDGQQWTDHVADAGQVSTDPVQPAESTGSDDTATSADDSVVTQADTVDVPPHSTEEPSSLSASTEPADVAAHDDEATTEQETDSVAADLAPDGSADGSDAVTASPEQGPAAPTTQAGAGETPEDALSPDYEGSVRPGPVVQTQHDQDSGAREDLFAPREEGAGPERGASTASTAAPRNVSTPTPPNGIALAALVIGVISLVLAIIPVIGLFGVVGGLVALLFGIIGRGRAKQGGVGRGAATAGVVTGLLAMVLGAIVTALVFLYFDGITQDFGTYVQCVQDTGDEQACADAFERRLFERLAR